MEDKMDHQAGEIPVVFEDVLEAKICKSIVTDYDGAVDPSNKHYQGEGMTLFDNESKYNGTYSNGLFDGKGSFRWKDGVLYSGDFKKGYIEGIGDYSWPDGSTYSGNIEFFKRQGTGLFKGGSGQSYEGAWKNGLRDGIGNMFYDESQTVSYQGAWKKGLRHGFGTMNYPSGNIYEGEWKDDKKCGEGVMIWQDRNEIYIGEWENDLANGEGEHIWVELPQKNVQRQTCNLYRGSFKNGKRNGHGTFFYANGSQYTGEWLDNAKNGQGCFIHPDGKVHYGKFYMDNMIFLNDESKESEAVTTQYKLNVTELLSMLPTIEKSPSFQQQIFDIERLILRYNTAIRTLIQKYTASASDSATFQKSVEKQSIKRQLHPSMLPPPTWSKMENLFHTRRDIHNKFFTIRMHQLCQFSRECDIIGPTMTSYDICMCVKKMHDEHNVVVNGKVKQFFDQIHQMREAVRRLEESSPDDQLDTDVRSTSIVKVASPAAPSLSAVEVNPELLRAVEDIDILQMPHLDLPPLLNYTFESDMYTDMRFPLRDREFVEAFVRIIAEASSRKHGGGVSGSGLFDNVYRMLAETMEPLSTEARPISVFVSALYSEAVQNVLLASEGSMRRLWDQVLEIAASSDKNSAASVCASVPNSMLSSAKHDKTFFSEDSCRPRVKHVVKLFMALKGSAVAEEGSSVLEILETLNKKGQPGDLSSLDLEVCFDDFVELFCRLVVSNLWIFEPEDVATANKDHLDGAVQRGDKKNNATIIESALVKRLSDWLPLI